MYILMISPNNFPEGDAGAVRDSCFARIYQELGYSVYHIGMNPNTEKGIYKNIEYRSLYINNYGLIRKIYNSLSYENRLNTICQKIFDVNGYPDLIHIYDIPKSGIEWTIKLAISKKIKIVHDSVEWYSPCEFKMGRFAYPYYLKNRNNTKVIRKPMAVYAISTFLEEHFINRGLDVLRVPVIMDEKEYNPQFTVNDVIQIVYAGSPAKKDYLSECVKAFASLKNEERKRIQFHIYGADQHFIDSCLNENSIPEIVAHGRVKREVVTDALSNSDFSILLRPNNERYAKAGFPTKSVEAMMNGCAMLCNISSDLGEYLIHLKNSIIIEDYSEAAVKKSLQEVLSLSKDEILQMKLLSRETAIKSFDYRIYIDLMKDFIENI